MAAVIVAGVVGIGVAFAYKGSNSGPREIAMIKAAPGPTKIQPAPDEAGDQPTRDASILDRAQQPAPTKLVSREEQPVDLAQTVQNAPRDPAGGIAPLYSLNAIGGSGGAASVPVPNPPGQQDGAGTAGDIQPIRVKTRSYRPDGTPIPNDEPPVAASPVAVPSAPRADKAVAKASTPKAAKPAAKPAKPVKTADATDNADDAAATQPAVTGGGFAVQLAAPGSEAEAKQTSTRLSQKFADALGGRRLSFHQAASNGKSVYRVRVSSLTRDEATSLCDKLKASGGTCFVAKN